MQRSALRHSSSIFAPVVTGSVYFIVATMALLISRFEGGLAFIWGANAFLMAELLTSRTRYWPRRQADASDSNSSVGAEMDGLRSLIFARAARTPAP